MLPADPSRDHARALLARLGAEAALPEGRPVPDEVRWARSGAMALTGRTDGPPCAAPGPLASAAQGAAAALRALAGRAWRGGELDGATLLGERAACAGFTRQGRRSPGGSCRLLRAADGWLALNLARPDDERLVSAWLEAEPERGDVWDFVATRVRERASADLVGRARLLGLPCAAAAPPPDRTPDWLGITHTGTARRDPPARAPLVVDLSALWAGPLCGDLLAHAGARVVKVESRERPDGARRDPSGFFDVVNGAKESVALELASERGRDALARLLERADVVIEASRPRALRQLGISAEALVDARPGLVWVSLTGYGRDEPQGSWVAFGDDAAVAAGLAHGTGGEGAPLFCGDAIADPLTGLHAALAAYAAWRAGRAQLLALALHDVAAHAAASGPPGSPEVGRTKGGDGWEIRGAFGREPVAAPRARAATRSAPPLGADTGRVLAELAPC